MAVTYIGAGALAVNATAATQDINAPTCLADDILIAVTVNRAVTSNPLLTPAGWTQWAAGFNNTTGAFDHNYGLYWRRAITADSGAAFTFTKTSNDSRVFGGIISAWRGCPTSGDPKDTAGVVVTETAASTDDVTFPALDPVATAVHVVYVAVYGDDLTNFGTAPTGSNPTMTVRFDVETGVGLDFTIACCSGDNDGANIASRTWASASTTDGGNTGIAFALLEGVAGTPISQSSITAWESLALALQSGLSPWESLAAVSQSGVTPWESLASLSASQALNYESLAGLSAQQLAAWEALAGLSAQALAAWESLAMLAASGVILWEALASLSRAQLAEWESLALAAREQPVAYESLGGIAQLSATQWESLTALIASGAVSWESLSGAAQTASAAWESLTGISRAQTTEWESLSALIAVAQSASVSFEALGRIAQSAATPYEALESISRAIVTSWESGATVTQAQPVAWESLMSVLRSGAVEFESLTGLSGSAASALESLAGVTSITVVPWESSISLVSVSGAVVTAYESAGVVVASQIVSWESLGIAVQLGYFTGTFLIRPSLSGLFKARPAQSGTVKTQPAFSGLLDTLPALSGKLGVEPTFTGRMRVNRYRAVPTDVVIPVPVSSAMMMAWESLVSPDDVLQLVSDLGGDTVVKAIYDVRAGVTATGGVVDSWRDYRGATGYGPLLSATGTARPAWDATNLLITSDDVDDHLTSAAFAGFDLSAGKALVFVGVIPAGTSGDSAACGICEASPYTRLLSIREPGTGARPIQGTARGSTVFPIFDSGALASATRRIAIASRNATTTVTIEVPSLAAVTDVTDAAAAGNLVLTVFALYPGVWQSGATARAVAVLNAPPTTAQVTLLKNWSVTNHAVVLA